MSSDVKTCFGSEGAAQVLRAAIHDHMPGCRCWGNSLFGGQLLCGKNGYLPQKSPGSIKWWAWSTYMDQWMAISRKTARLILRGLLAPDAFEMQLVMAEGRENGIIETNIKWMEKLREAVRRRHSCCCAGETCNECMEELLREMGVAP